MIVKFRVPISVGKPVTLTEVLWFYSAPPGKSWKGNLN